MIGSKLDVLTGAIGTGAITRAKLDPADLADAAKAVNGLEACQ